mmetsp:Transcript_82110/g.230365  ORF Transcript_82110/g.230365 Transcript_82110/m.230365 type:complete len:86 (-) Transcript_82110:92-349(-)
MKLNPNRTLTPAFSRAGVNPRYVPYKAARAHRNQTRISGNSGKVSFVGLEFTARNLLSRDGFSSVEGMLLDLKKKEANYWEQLKK